MELRQLRHFVAVVEAGSLTAAATHLHLAQPSLSVSIRRLETEFGVTLLTRTSRGVEPTAAGRRLLDDATRVLAEVDGLGDVLRRFGAGAAGSLTLAAVPVLMWHRVPQLLRLQSTEAPGVEVRLLDPPLWRAIDLLRQRSVDAAAVMVAAPSRFVPQHREEFDLTDWGEVPLVAALPPDEQDAADPLPLSAFAGRRVVLPRRIAALASLPEAVDEAFRRHGVAPAEVRHDDTIQTSVPFVESGAAWAILPDPDRASLGRFDLTVRELDPAPTPLRAFVLTRRGASADATLAGLLRRVTRTASTDRVRSSIG